MTKKSNNNPGEIAPDSTDSRTDEPSFEDFLALVRRKMIEHGEDPDVTEEEESPWLH